MLTKEMKEVTKLNVSEDILLATNKCSNYHVCLEIAPEKLCEIELNFEGIEKIYWCKHRGYCNYKFTCFSVNGDCDYLCTCPTRIEIYEKYNI
jgi:hypothetical protein